MKKYILTDEIIACNNRILHRIEAVKDFAYVKSGDKGGFIENENNLSHLGDAWVFGDAKVCEDAQVFGNALVGGNAKIQNRAQVFGDAQVFGNAAIAKNAKIYENAQIYGNAKVSGNNAEIYGFAQVCGNAQVRQHAKIYGDALVGGMTWVYGDAKVFGNTRTLGGAEVLGNAKIRSGDDMATVSNFGTENRPTTFFRNENGEILVKCGCFFGNLETFREQVRNTRDGYFAEEYLMIADLMEMRFKNRECKE